MPMIRTSSDVRNQYASISDYCHENDEPVFITRNGKEDLVVMSSELYKKITEHLSIYYQLAKQYNNHK